MNILLIEDNSQSAKELIERLLQCNGSINILPVLQTVEESIAYLNSNETVKPSLIFSDVELLDGLSFEIFRSINSVYPTVFVTAYEEYIIESIQSYGIHLIIKPVELDEVALALKKYNGISDHFSHQYQSFLNQKNFIAGYEQDKILIFKKGTEYKTIKVKDIVYLYTDQKLVFAMATDGSKYLSTKNLKDVFDELPPGMFFKANRQTIINKDFMDTFRTVDKVKIEVKLKATNNVRLPNITISQDYAADFRRWIGL
jgi:two-component system response regulator LytT